MGSKLDGETGTSILTLISDEAILLCVYGWSHNPDTFPMYFYAAGRKFWITCF